MGFGVLGGFRGFLGGFRVWVLGLRPLSSSFLGIPYRILKRNYVGAYG